MSNREDVYNVIYEVLEDGNGHPVSELNEALEARFGLTLSQSTGKIFSLVRKGILDNYERGMYRLSEKPALSNKENINKIQYIFTSIRTTIYSLQLKGVDIMNISDKDKEALKVLKEIDLKVKEVLDGYCVENE